MLLINIRAKFRRASNGICIYRINSERTTLRENFAFQSWVIPVLRRRTQSPFAAHPAKEPHKVPAKALVHKLTQQAWTKLAIQGRICTQVPSANDAQPPQSAAPAWWSNPETARAIRRRRSL